MLRDRMKSAETVSAMPNLRDDRPMLSETSDTNNVQRSINKFRNYRDFFICLEKIQLSCLLEEVSVSCKACNNNQI